MEEVKKEYGIDLIKDIADHYDCVVLAVGHNDFKKLDLETLSRHKSDKLLVFDVKGILSGHGNFDYLKL